MTIDQFHKVKGLLRRIAKSHEGFVIWVHHGDCTGSDEEFHEIVRELVAEGYAQFKIHVHPPDRNKLRAYCKGDSSEVPKPYKIRNQDIVRESELLIATPHKHENDGSQKFSGTWATVRIARRRDKSYVIFYSDGRREGGNKWKRMLK